LVGPAEPWPEGVEMSQEPRQLRPVEAQALEAEGVLDMRALPDDGLRAEWNAIHVPDAQKKRLLSRPAAVERSWSRAVATSAKPWQWGGAENGSNKRGKRCRRLRPIAWFVAW
jgi:hypothetical protein